MSGSYIGTNGYYEGDKISPEDLEVPPRPDPSHTWVGDAWEISPEKNNEDVKSEIISIEKESLMNRAVREAMITMALERAAALIPPLNLAQLRAANPGFKAIDDVNNTIKDLRTKLL